MAYSFFVEILVWINMNKSCKLNFDYLRSEVVGADAAVTTPFGERLMVYADYTASGRCLGLVEKYLQNLQRIYANTHTEDDISGRSMTQLLEQAEHAIKRSVNAGMGGASSAQEPGHPGPSTNCSNWWAWRFLRQPDKA